MVGELGEAVAEGDVVVALPPYDGIDSKVIPAEQVSESKANALIIVHICVFTERDSESRE